MADTGTPKLILAGLCALIATGAAWGQTAPSAGAGQPATPAYGKHPERSVSEWLMRMHEASRLRW